MKCDTCQNVAHEPASIDNPYHHTYCLKGYWEGYDYGEEPEFDPWENCRYYKEDKRSKI